MQSGPGSGSAAGLGPKPVTTRTLGPLHFEDLEPHRFEDLVRQLVYQFKSWEYLEAIGRSGDDGGVDIRGVEAMAAFTEAPADSSTGTADETPEGPSSGRAGEPRDETAADPSNNAPVGSATGAVPTGIGSSSDDATADVDEREAFEVLTRTWLIQVKREKRFGPAQARAVAAAARFDDNLPPAGFILAVSADVSRTTRRELTIALRNRGVGHVLVWSAGELEDMLFDPDHDHLLFAYFGISLSIRKRAASTRLRARHATKRQVFRATGGLDKKAAVTVLLRDPDEAAYPDARGVARWDPTNPPWMVTAFREHHPEGIVVDYVRHHGWWSDDDTYDLIDTCSHPFGNRPNRPPGRPRGTAEIHGQLPELTDERARRGRRGSARVDESCDRAWYYSHSVVPESEQAWVVGVGLVLFDDILLVDDLGDPFNGPPHLLLPRDHADGFFSRTKTIIEPARRHRDGPLEPPRDRGPTELTSLTRRARFPDPLPPVAKQGGWPGAP